jgi:hypothetical protein
MPAVTEASAMARAMQGTGGGIALGAGYGTVGAATGFNPLSVMPDPLHAALYGGMIFNPFRAVQMAKQGLFGFNPKNKYTTWKIRGEGLAGDMITKKFKVLKTAAETRFGGMLGYRTLLLGVQPGANIAARASIGNIMLSGIQALGQGMSANADWALIEGIQKMAKAKKLGLAGLFTDLSTEKVGGKVGKELTESWLYKMAGVDVSKTKLVASGITGKTTPGITKGLMKQGLNVGATSAGARVFSAALGMYSTFAWFELFGGIAKAGGAIAMEGVGEAARSFFQYVNEIQRPEFGKGRLNVAMQSAGAATERQRAVRASYGSKINPTNRLFGTEAMYHHSR